MMNFTKYRPVSSSITDKYDELVNNPTHNLTDSENTLKDLLSTTEHILKFPYRFVYRYYDQLCI